MNSVLISTLTAAILLGPAPTAGSQEALPSQLVSAREAVEREINEKAPGWVRRPVAPMEGSRNLIIDQWELGAFVVKVVIQVHASREEAADSIQKGRRQLEVEEEATRGRGRPNFQLIKGELQDVAEGGYAWEDTYGATAASFREGNFTVHVSVVRPDLNKDDKLSKEFAKHVAKALRSL